MRRINIGVLFLVAILNTTTPHAVAQKAPTELTGTWSCILVTVLEKGKPSSLVHYEPGQWAMIFYPQGTWYQREEIGGKFYESEGRYERHGDKIVMRDKTGEIFVKYRMTIAVDGSVVLAAKDLILTLVRQ